MSEQTPQLYDEGEEHWRVRLHLGCGGVYLTGYINADLHGTQVDSPPFHATTITDYYKGLHGDAGAIPARRDACVDAYADMRHIDTLTTRPVSKIVYIQALEHLGKFDAIEALGRWGKAMRPGGVLIVSVPDSLRTLDTIARDDNPDFGVRHLLGKRDGGGYYHRSHWTRDTIHTALWDAGFGATSELVNIHFYPAIVVRAVKQGGGA